MHNLHFFHVYGERRRRTKALLVRDNKPDDDRIWGVLNLMTKLVLDLQFVTAPKVMTKL